MALVDMVCLGVAPSCHIDLFFILPALPVLQFIIIVRYFGFGMVLSRKIVSYMVLLGVAPSCHSDHYCIDSSRHPPFKSVRGFGWSSKAKCLLIVRFAALCLTEIVWRSLYASFLALRAYLLRQVILKPLVRSGYWGDEAHDRGNIVRGSRPL